MIRLHLCEEGQRLQKSERTPEGDSVVPSPPCPSKFQETPRTENYSEEFFGSELCFNPNAHLSQLLFQVLDATKRLGCEEMEGYGPLKAHPFFESISWEDLHHQTPPKLTAYLPAMSEDDEDCYGNVSHTAASLRGDGGRSERQWRYVVEGGEHWPRGPHWD